MRDTQDFYVKTQIGKKNHREKEKNPL